ncbi:ATP-binding cassette domain-containing protein, partial [Candidatus Pelagibacter sp.]|nr:ATP-binding cassette domain-containing protein [Candidatus Pelagibacter sp.]
GLISLLFYKIVKNKLTKLASGFLRSQTESIKIINQTFGSLKENIILDLRSILINKFSFRIKQVQKFEFFRSFIKSIPRVLFELVAIIAIVMIANVFLFMNKNEDYILQALTLIGICSIRLIPSFNGLTNSFATIKSYNEIFNKFCTDIYFFESLKDNKKYFKIKKYNFKKSIVLKNISFKYPRTKKNIISNGNLIIKKGHTIGISGRSGSGKTTLIDIITGLLEKTSGQYIIDGNNISHKIAFNKNEVGYVPQSPYLFDDTIENNILFGRSVKDKKKIIKQSIKLSQIEKFISQLPKGLQTYVGNNGARLSGGQKQRIVIARALLFKPELIIFDEATSSLDTKTENELIKEIYKLKKITTVVIISHKKEIIDQCDYKYIIKDNKIFKG